MTDETWWDVYLTYGSDDDDMPIGWAVSPKGVNLDPERPSHFLSCVRGRENAIDRAKRVFQSTVKTLKQERDN